MTVRAIRGDFKKLRRLIVGASMIAEGAMIHGANTRMGKKTLELAKAGAQAGRAPSGRKWRPLKAHTDAVSGALALAASFASHGQMGAARSAGKMASDLARSGGGGRPLAWIAGSLRPRFYRSGFLIFSGIRFAHFHQKGAKREGTKWRLPVRAVLPGTRKLPKKWRVAVEFEALNVFRRIMAR